MTSFWQQLADFWNGLLAFFQNAGRLSHAVQDPIGAITGQNVAPPTSQGGKPVQASIGGRCHVTDVEVISARFNDTGPNWGPQGVNNPGGKHLGTDFAAPMGSNVYAPYDLGGIIVGSYSAQTDPLKAGIYVIGYTADGAEYYSGHLQSVSVKQGDHVTCGQKLGVIGPYNHTHVQMKTSGNLIDPELYFKAHP